MSSATNVPGFTSSSSEVGSSSFDLQLAIPEPTASPTSPVIVTDATTSTESILCSEVYDSSSEGSFESRSSTSLTIVESTSSFDNDVSTPSTG
ncbi:hypothetical protein Cantr_06172 [Candida viswanathii]|uniref:Uncharacterized protein n=1 Tax=Candida viswanathii TaxID=5486 RepID=A0A367XV36_9ASCO|nr:hypothetical protein Cantr_06172 [Candida viswanathii]